MRTGASPGGLGARLDARELLFDRPALGLVGVLVDGLAQHRRGLVILAEPLVRVRQAESVLDRIHVFGVLGQAALEGRHRLGVVPEGELAACDAEGQLGAQIEEGVEGALVGALIVGICRAAAVHLVPQVELFVIYGVMALVLLYPKMEPRRIVGSDIAHAVPLTLAAGIGHTILGSINWHILGSLLVGSIPSIIVMSIVAARASDTAVRITLALVLLIVCARFWFFA